MPSHSPNPNRFDLTSAYSGKTLRCNKTKTGQHFPFLFRIFQMREIILWNTIINWVSHSRNHLKFQSKLQFIFFLFRQFRTLMWTWKLVSNTIFVEGQTHVILGRNKREASVKTKMMKTHIIERWYMVENWVWCCRLPFDIFTESCKRKKP